jgi:exosortase
MAKGQRALMANREMSIKKHRAEILVGILFLISYTPIIIWMAERWFSENSYYSHGILIPLVSFLLVWERRDSLKNLPYVPSAWSFRLFIFGIIIYWLSAILHIYFSASFSMLLILASLILHFYGKVTFRYVLFPLLFLVFMIPLPLIVVAAISFKLKLIAAQLATWMINGLHVPAVLWEASLIKMKHSVVVVEDACGGLRSLISLTALGAIFGYRMRGTLTKKIIIFFSAIPIAVVTNAIRIVFLSLIGEIWGSQYTEGFLHSFSGSLVFAFAFLFLFAFKKLLT